MNDTNKIFKVPCTFEMYGVLHVKAKDKEEAIKKAYSSNAGLLLDKFYVDDSFNVCEESIEVVDEAVAIDVL